MQKGQTISRIRLPELDIRENSGETGVEMSGKAVAEQQDVPARIAITEADGWIELAEPISRGQESGSLPPCDTQVADVVFGNLERLLGEPGRDSVRGDHYDPDD
jgi:hypothetical protein